MQASLYAAALIAIVVSRRPDALTHPQFYAEDGAFWFAEAYNDGPFHPLLWTHTGYFQTISRLTADLSLPFGYLRAPLIFNIVAIAVQVAPALYFVSNRFAKVAPSVRVRGLIGLTYVCLANGEVHANVTNAQWHLAILGALILLAAPARSRLGRSFDVCVLVLCGLSGPFVALLIPVAVARWLRSRDHWARTLAMMTTALGVLEGGAALVTAGRSQAPLGATPRLLASIVVDRVIVPPFAGQDSNTDIFSPGWPYHTILAGLVLAAAAALVLWAMVRAGDELRLFLVFAMLVVGFSLFRPQIDLLEPQWPRIATSSVGDRYFLIPSLAMVALVAWVLSQIPRRLAWAGATALAAVFVVGAAGHWQYPAFADLHPERDAQQLDAAPPGTKLIFHINPAGWLMEIDKK